MQIFKQLYRLLILVLVMVITLEATIQFEISPVTKKAKTEQSSEETVVISSDLPDAVIPAVTFPTTKWCYICDVFKGFVAQSFLSNTVSSTPILRYFKVLFSSTIKVKAP